MSCRNCGNKASRYDRQPPILKGNMDGSVETVSRNTENTEAPHTGPGFVPVPDLPDSPEEGIDPLTALFAAKKMSYEELTDRRKFQQQVVLDGQERILEQMTESMKRVHAEELIAVANCEKMALPGMHPGQAIIALREALARSDFRFMEDLYPGLTEAVEVRYQELQKNRLPGPRN